MPALCHRIWPLLWRNGVYFSTSWILGWPCDMHWMPWLCEFCATQCGESDVVWLPSQASRHFAASADILLELGLRAACCEDAQSGVVEATWGRTEGPRWQPAPTASHMSEAILGPPPQLGCQMTVAAGVTQARPADETSSSSQPKLLMQRPGCHFKPMSFQWFMRQQKITETV